jgi:hypothetical protein
LGEARSGFRGPFKPQAYCNIYNLHGGLHLFLTSAGEVEKRIASSSGVIDSIAETIVQDKRLPIYVAESTSDAKLAKINSISYLRHCYELLGESRGTFFVFGASARENDEHIYKAIFGSKIDHLYFCVYHPTPADLSAINGRLAHYAATSASQIDYSFVDAESANVWNRPSEN